MIHPRLSLSRTAGAACLLAALASFLGGCASTIPITSTPAGATVFVNRQPIGVTPMASAWDNGRDNVVRFELPGYFPEEIEVPKGAGELPLSVRLSPVNRARTFQIVSQPPGAAIELDGERVGTTPAQVEVGFTRTDRSEAWRDRVLTLALADHQTESFRLSASLPAIGVITLAPLRLERNYRIGAVTPDGAELKADVTLDGQPAGTTPLDLPLTFRRRSKSEPWPRFTVAVAVPGQYRAESAVLDLASGSAVQLTLAPITEITTTRMEPGPVMTPTGVAWGMREFKATAVLNARETSDAVLELNPVTAFTRQDLKGSTRTRAESINSFTVSPDGKNVIFALTSRDQDGNLYSNLFIKRTDGAAGGVAQLTQGMRYIDTQPKIANDGSNYLVFTSNRGDHAKPDIFRTNLIDNSLSGGISRLTNDLRFNFAPTYGEANRQVFYLSVEQNFPLAEIQLSSIRINGSLPTLLSVTAQEIDNSVPDRVYFVKLDDDTKKQQIYSIQADGNLESALISQENLRNSDCFDPAPSPDGGSRIAFVSDAGVDDQSRHNHDLYLINADGSGLQRLTQNGSDDIKPAWSPSEDGVLYFLSNRGGAYNIWRMKLRSGSTPSRPAGTSP